MIKALPLFLALFLAACTGAAFDEPPNDVIEIEGEPDGTELATFSQPLVLPSAYGVYTGGGRCPGVVAANKACYVAEDKQIRYKFYASTCIDYVKTRMVEAMQVYFDTLNARGWLIRGPDSQDRHDVAIKCTNTPFDPAVDPPLLGQFEYCTSGCGTSCSNVAGIGRVCKVTKGTVWIHQGAASHEASTYWGPGDSRTNAGWRNLILHELGHSAFLAHHGSKNGDLMASGGAGINGWWNGNHMYTTAELDGLTTYAP